ncbi:hypothetical protein L2D14_18395 [Thalassospiraceae bacterium LMO-JJ14]|nr:hypothetical protein L2D14_18395 [Thalassospiraceae bacterium LMO-JJ14]
MGSFTATTPPAKGASTATGNGASTTAATSHADQIQGAPAAPLPAPAAPVVPAYTHADQIQGAVPLEDGTLSGGHREAISWPDPSASPWLNPPTAPLNALDPFGGRGTQRDGASAATPQLPPPPPLPERPAPTPRATPGLAGRTATSGQTPVYAPNEAEGGGNSAASAAYVQRKNADAAKIARTEAQVERRHDEAREKQRRAERKAGERAARWHAEEMADAQKDATRRREQLAKTVATRVRQLMEPQGHPGLSDDAGIARAARHADLSTEAAASNERQVSALGRIRGVGDLPTYTADAAENYGEQGVHEVADLIHRTAKADPDQGKALLEQTTARISAAKADRLKATVASLGLDDEPGAESGSSNELQAQSQPNGSESKRPPEEKENNKEEEIEWNEKPSEQVYDGRNEFNVDGPIKIDPSSVTLGLDGLKYEVDWYTLDKNGNVVPEWRSNDFKPKEGTASSIYGYSGKSETYHPPIPSKHGYRVIIRVPPQHSYNGNSTGIHLNVYSPKGTRMNKISK